MVEFDCPDCDMHVYAAGLTEPVPPGQRCALCQWLADIKDPLEREQLRAEIGAIEWPGYWMNETTGPVGGLRPAVEAYLNNGPMTEAQIAAMRGYLRQWICSPVWDESLALAEAVAAARAEAYAGAEERAWLAGMRLACDALLSRQAIKLWIDRAIDRGIDPL